MGEDDRRAEAVEARRTLEDEVAARVGGCGVQPGEDVAAARGLMRRKGAAGDVRAGPRDARSPKGDGNPSKNRTEGLGLDRARSF